jgi:hypothetical protein
VQRDPNAPPWATRLDAVDLILSRAWEKPRERIELYGEDRVDCIMIGMEARTAP